MLNAEKYREDIIKILIDEKQNPALSKNKTIVSCKDLKYDCHDCFLNETDCEKTFILWMLEVYKAPIKLTEKEKAFIIMIIDNYGYLARDEDSYLIWYKVKPIKDKSFGCWICPNKEDAADPRLSFTLTPPIYPQFDFIKWEDEEPYSITELFERGVL